MNELFQPGARPRCWIAGYDLWHLAAPACLALVVSLLVWLPPPPPPPPPPALAPPLVLAPAPGSRVRADLFTSIEGRAPAGSWVRLFWERRFLSQQAVRADGRFQFSLAGVAPGANTFHVQAVHGQQSAWSAPLVVLVDPAPAPPTRPRPKRRG